MTITSGLFRLNSFDFLKGLVVATFTTPLTMILDSLNQGSLEFDWRHIGIVALIGLISYLLKNLLTPSQIVTPSKPYDEIREEREIIG